MARPRKEQLDIKLTPYYHVTSRCVRRAFLCGYDHATHTNYEHRRQWVEDRIRLLSSLFAIDICSYAIMSNHYHIVVKLCPEQADTWTEEDVMRRWLCLFHGTRLVQRYSKGQVLSAIEQQTVSESLAVYKDRLKDLSWFMKCLNEPTARRSNKEDKCTGHFWEGRYKAQAMVNESTLLSGMAYVDLNPIRAGVAETPEHSAHTSLKERITQSFNVKKAVEDQMAAGHLLGFNMALKPLLPFFNGDIQQGPPSIPMRFADYLELVDWTGRVARQDKCGRIPSQCAPILTRINLSSELWLENATKFEARYRVLARRRHSNE
ncbi:MAG: hypothetical protein HKN70_06650 [Gammaproteobacteria bacterium]|nr:hypothetical protein [Gammaproteobacteria bacterium]